MNRTRAGLGIGAACLAVACGGRALTNADAVNDASIRVTNDASIRVTNDASIRTLNDATVIDPGVALADSGPCPGTSVCFTCSGVLYCADECGASGCPATLLDAGAPMDAGASADAGYAPSLDGGVCPAGMSLCYGCWFDLFCAAACPLPCLPPTLPPECPGGVEECACYGSLYCGADACASECAPRQADAGWCSSSYGPVSADQSDATAATPCSGQCVPMLEIDASTNGEIPVDYGCQLSPSTCPAGMVLCPSPPCTPDAGPYCAVRCPAPYLCP